MRALAALGLLTANACTCLPEPASDPSPPNAGLIIEFRAPGAPSRETRTFSQQDGDQTITASMNDVVAVVYSGGDPQGLREVELEYDMELRTGNTVVQPLLVAKVLTASCPREALLDSENFDPDGSPWKYEFNSRSENWLGANTRSARITVRTQ